MTSTFLLHCTITGRSRGMESSIDGMLCPSTEGRLIARNWIPSFVVHFFHRSVGNSAVESDMPRFSPIHLRLLYRRYEPLEPLLYVITPLQPCVYKARGPRWKLEVNYAGRYDATPTRLRRHWCSVCVCVCMCAFAVPRRMVIDGRDWSTGPWPQLWPPLTWNCYVCNEVIMHRWTTHSNVSPPRSPIEHGDKSDLLSAVKVCSVPLPIDVFVGFRMIREFDIVSLAETLGEKV